MFGPILIFRAPSSKFLKFWSISGAIFAPKTLQNCVRDPLEKTINSAPFFRFFTDFWPIVGPKTGDRVWIFGYFFVFLAAPGHLGASRGARTAPGPNFH